MKPSTKLFHPVLFSLLFIIACNDDDPQPTLPSITQDGLNTFGCIINGELLVPKDGRSSLGGAGKPGLKSGFFYYSDSVNYISITAGNYYDADGDDIYIYIPQPQGEGTYDLGISNGQVGLDSPPHPHIFTKIFSHKNEGQLYFSFENSGRITVTRFDSLRSIVSGVFELKVYNRYNLLDTIEITDGRFDINWSTLDKE